MGANTMGANTMGANIMGPNAIGANAMGANASESAYIAQLNPMEQKILQIAQSHLETSFSLNKSIGFQEWQKAQQVQAPHVQAPAPQPTPASEPATQAKPPPLIVKRKIKIKSV